MASTSTHSDVDPIREKVEKYNLDKVTINGNEKFPDITWASPKYLQEMILPEQGFKLHISATILNAEQIFDLAVPFLLQKCIPFKVIGSKMLLRQMNDNFFGFTQVGKFITIYPTNEKEAVELAHQLDPILNGFKSPIIPSDRRLHDESIVFYRYGKITQASNREESEIIILPNGQQIKDNRDPKFPVPKGIYDPFNPIVEENQKIKNLLADRFILLKVLRQAAKGGTYIALDMNNKGQEKKPSLIILKEARRLGVLEPSGIDAVQRLHWQFSILKEVVDLNITPKPIALLDYENNSLLAIRKFGNFSLKEKLLSKKFTITIVLRWLMQTADILSSLHKRGIYFFDLSPDNILVSESGKVKIIDFEFAVKNDGLLFAGWESGTPGFSPKDKVIAKAGNFNQQLICRDIYSLGCILYAIYNPVWYEEIIDGKYSNQLYWAKARHKLPEALQALFATACLEGDKFYPTVDSFIQDLKEYTHANCV